MSTDITLSTVTLVAIFVLLLIAAVSDSVGLG